MQFLILEKKDQSWIAENLVDISELYTIMSTCSDCKKDDKYKLPIKINGT